jgi:hypothetical protein
MGRKRSSEVSNRKLNSKFTSTNSITSGQKVLVQSSSGNIQKTSIENLLGSSFETINKNLKSYPSSVEYTDDGDIQTITYDLGSNGAVTKTFTYTGKNLTFISLRGSVPSGIPLTKELVYDSEDNLINIEYNL